jgi:hypothetical protein
MELDAQFVLRPDEGGENELVALHGASLEDGNGVKGFRNVRMARHFSHVHAGRMVQDVAYDEFLLHPAQKNHGVVKAAAVQIGGGNQKVARQVFIADIFMFHHGHKSTLTNVTDAGNHAFKQPCQEAEERECRKNGGEGRFSRGCNGSPWRNGRRLWSSSLSCGLPSACGERLSSRRPRSACGKGLRREDGMPGGGGK